MLQDDTDTMRDSSISQRAWIMVGEKHEPAERLSPRCQSHPPINRPGRSGLASYQFPYNTCARVSHLFELKPK